MTASISSLVERLSVASGPEYMLDCAIWDLIYPGERDERFAKLTAKGEPYHGRLGPADKDGYIKPLRAFTASVDAALTLLDLWDEHPEWQITRRYCTGFHASIGTGGETVGCETPALALCIAALKAKDQSS